MDVSESIITCQPQELAIVAYREVVDGHTIAWDQIFTHEDRYWHDCTEGVTLDLDEMTALTDAGRVRYLPDYEAYQLGLIDFGVCPDCYGEGTPTVRGLECMWCAQDFDPEED